jgi:hypothetical protein
MDKAPVTLEPSFAERLLLVAGPVMLPDRAVQDEARNVWDDMVRDLLKAIDREEQGPLLDPNVSMKYWDKLQRFEPDYSEVIEALGTDGAAFQALQLAARDALLKRKTVSTVDTVRGPHVVDVAPHGIDEMTWLLEADTVENPKRLVADLAAGALVYLEVQIFADCFPDTYSGLVQVAQLAMAEKPPEWLPPMWLADGLTTLFQEPLGFGETEKPAPRPLKPQRSHEKQVVEAMRGPNEAGL